MKHPAPPPTLSQPDLTAEATRRLSAHPTPTKSTLSPLTERTVRFYRAQSLLDPPVAWKGRTPLFDEHHVDQLVAIRRLQAAGLSLDQIRGWLARASRGEVSQMAQQAGEPDAEALLFRAPDPDRGARRARRRAWAAAEMDEPAGEPVAEPTEASAEVSASFRRELDFDAPPALESPVASALAAPAPARPASGTPTTTRLAPGVYLVIDPETAAAAGLDAEDTATALSRAGRVLRSLAAGLRPGRVSRKADDATASWGSSTPKGDDQEHHDDNRSTSAPGGEPGTSQDPEGTP